MDTSAFFELGQQLHDFFVRQFSPPPGAKTVLGFLGTGVAVEPDSFLSQGQFNPARINTWLNIVVDPLGSITEADHRIDAAPMTASTLMEAICAEAKCLAPAGTDEQLGFAKIKSRAMEDLGGACIVSTAPLDWYDPAHLPQWSPCSLTTSTTDTSTTSTGETPTRSPLWAWRTLQNVQIDHPPPRDLDVATTEVMRRPVSTTGNAMLTRRMFATSSIVAAPSSAVSATVAVAPAARFVQAAEFTQQARTVSISRAPFVIATERPANVSDAILISKAISTAANEASTSTVNCSSLTLNLSYRVVQLSRAPWWNEVLTLLNNWYIPGMQRAALVNEPIAQSVIGIPIALILTNNVEIRAKWSATDRAASTTNTHIGPWTLSSAKFTATDKVGEAAMTIPGMSAIACIYRALPALPPKPDPSIQ